MPPGIASKLAPLPLNRLDGVGGALVCSKGGVDLLMGSLFQNFCHLFRLSWHLSLDEDEKLGSTDLFRDHQ